MNGLNLQKNMTIKKTPKHSFKKDKKLSHMVRKDIYLDEITYSILLDLVSDCDYDTETNETSEGISGVLTMAIHRMNDNLDKIKKPRENQQLMLLARESILHTENGDTVEDVCEIFNRKKALRYQCPNNFNSGEKWTEKSIRKLVTKYIEKYKEPKPFVKTTGFEFEDESLFEYYE